MTFQNSSLTSETLESNPIFSKSIEHSVDDMKSDTDINEQLNKDNFYCRTTNDNCEMSK